MLGQNLRRSIVLAAFAGISAFTLVLSAAPEHPFARVEAGIEQGNSALTDCRTGPKPKIEAARMALFTRCISGSDEIALHADRISRDDRLAGRNGIAPAGRTAESDRRCGRAVRPVSGRHSVCYAAILPEWQATGGDD